MTFQIHHDSEGPTLRVAVFQALGYASGCWETVANAGEFQSNDARDAGNVLIDDIKGQVTGALTKLFDQASVADEWNRAVEQCIKTIEELP